MIKTIAVLIALSISPFALAQGQNITKWEDGNYRFGPVSKGVGKIHLLVKVPENLTSRCQTALDPKPGIGFEPQGVLDCALSADRKDLEYNCQSKSCIPELSLEDERKRKNPFALK